MIVTSRGTSAHTKVVNQFAPFPAFPQIKNRIWGKGLRKGHKKPFFQTIEHFSSPKFHALCNLGEARRGLTGIFFQGRNDVPIELCYNMDI